LPFHLVGVDRSTDEVIHHGGEQQDKEIEAAGFIVEK
jgi:hypothetical protein